LIVDSSALAAVALGEMGWEGLLTALSNSKLTIPATVLTEVRLATAKRGAVVITATSGLVERLLANGAEVAAFEKRHADITALAQQKFGKGNGNGGLLNFGDLMVYAIAADRGEALLCTGRDFASTDLEIHPASRLDA
jgi:ribonuclease VapC